MHMLRCSLAIRVRTHTLSTCPGCASEHSSPLELDPEHQLRRCESCGLVYAPAFADPDDIYTDGYILEGGQFGANFDVMHPTFQEFVAHAADRRLDLIERVARPPGRFLDVGCGTGEMLVSARDRGWTAQGAEPVEDSARYARDERGLDVRPTLLQDSGLPKRSYDVVAAFHVLEHLTDAPAFLRTIAEWAVPGGYVVIEVPNWRSVNRRVSGSSWIHLRPLEHLAHYSPKTLAATLRRAGLEPAEVHTPGFLWPRQSLDQALSDVGARRLEGWFRRARVLTRTEVRDGAPVTVPSGLGWWGLRALESAYSFSRTGMVVLAIARVP
jgi:SAM-dependent methyltransferase